ncbi:FAD-dependent oxidoreductase [Nocardioides ungokensis]|uniref:FAD-dependent oxidoreductase n=1 Tax=Nocardioides ungokensis TaxID=1643322 RepID=UPI001C6086C7|nr:FAD-dependent oxidoreductase [Nocardioides ungokensis]
MVGTSVAYHLTRLGWDDVLLLEQGSSRAVRRGTRRGWWVRCAPPRAATRLVQYSAELYASLEAETGQATGYRNVGGVIVARTEDRMVQLRRTAANAAAYGMDCELLTPAGRWTAGR